MLPCQPYSRPELARRLGACSFFAHYPESDIQILADATKACTATKGYILCQQAVYCGALFLLNRGIVELSRSEQGVQRKVMRLLYAGDSFGEFAVFSREGSPLTATVVEDVELLMIDADVFLGFLTARTDRLVGMLETLNQEAVRWMTELHRQHALNATRRVAAYLLERHQRQTKIRGNSTAVELRLGPRTEVASLLAIRPETLSRTLREFREAQLITDSHHGITVTNAEQLARRADDIHGSAPN